MFCAASVAVLATRQTARRAFVVAWILLGLVGALNHTVLDHRLNLLLPHLRYGYVMFDRNPRVARVYRFTRGHDEPRDLAELEQTPAFGYARARLIMSVAAKPTYLAEVCRKAMLRGDDDALTVLVDEYAIVENANRLTRSVPLTCRELIHVPH